MNSSIEPVDYIARTREQYSALGYQPYEWAERPDPPAWVPLTKPLEESRILLLGSGGAYKRGQVAFHWKDDTGIRLIPSDQPATDVRVTHFAYDLEPARSDPNIVFPLDRLNELVQEGFIKSLTPQSLAFMGGIYSVRRTEEELIPALIKEIEVMEIEIDLALLVPV